MKHTVQLSTSVLTWRGMFYKRGCKTVIRESILSFDLENIALGAGSLDREI